MRKYLTEFVGTLFLVFTISCAVISGGALAPLAIGAVLTAAVYAGGHISGAHYNPAVTLAVYLRGKLNRTDVLPYLAAQILGGLAGAGLGRLVVGPPTTPALHLTGSAIGAAFTAEVVVTFALAYVVLNVATSKSHPGNSFYGLAIGFTVLSGAIAVGGVSGGVFNPAVALAASAEGLLSWSTIWVYLAANLTGGALAAAAFRALNPAEFTTEATAPSAVQQESIRPG
jgi:aquaporin Z